MQIFIIFWMQLISLTNTGKGKLSVRLSSLQRSSKIQYDHFSCIFRRRFFMSFPGHSSHLSTYGGDYPRHFFQHPIPRSRHPKYFVSRCNDGIHPFPKLNTKWLRHLQFVVARPQAGTINFSKYTVSNSRWSISFTGFLVCTTWFDLQFSLLQPSAPNVTYTNLHCSSSTTLHSNDTSHPSLSSSNRVSRLRAFTPQPHTEKNLSEIWDPTSAPCKVRSCIIQLTNITILYLTNIIVRQKTWIPYLVT